MNNTQKRVWWQMFCLSANLSAHDPALTRAEQMLVRSMMQARLDPSDAAFGFRFARITSGQGAPA